MVLFQFWVLERFLITSRGGGALTGFSSSALADAGVLLLLERDLQQQQLPVQPRLRVQEGRSMPGFPQRLLPHGRKGKRETGSRGPGMGASLLKPRAVFPASHGTEGSRRTGSSSTPGCDEQQSCALPKGCGQRGLVSLRAGKKRKQMKGCSLQITESQNGRGWKGPLWVTQSNPLPKQGHPEQAAQELVQVGLEYLQRRRLHNLPGQPGPVLCHPQREEVLPHLQLELRVLQFVPVSPCPVAGHH